METSNLLSQNSFHMTMNLLLKRSIIALALAVSVAAHGSHEQEALQEDDWATRHMAEEHHIGNYDAASFFSLHDYDSNGVWTTDEVLRTYGLEDESLKATPEAKKEEVKREVLLLIDSNGDSIISQQEWMDFNKRGGKLPDFGLGPGHHGDDEYEYEIHHYEKYHDENTREEDLIHPEDIAHFKKHEEEADAEDRQTELDKMPIVEHNIPLKFRRSG